VETAKRLITGLSMLLARLLLLVGFAIHPAEPKSAAQLLKVITDNAGRWDAAHIAFAVSMVLSVPANLGLMELLEHRGAARFSLIEGGLIVVGVIFHPLHRGRASDERYRKHTGRKAC
jgi:uncharacterized membrane protein YkvI